MIEDHFPSITTSDKVSDGLVVACSIFKGGVRKRGQEKEWKEGSMEVWEMKEL